MLSQFVINDGNQTVAILNLNDSYGNSFAVVANTTIAESGGEVVEHITYDPAAVVLRHRGRRGRRGGT